jgi:hypothetical protein
MKDIELLLELLTAANEDAALAALEKRGLFQQPSRWCYLGNMPNNQAIVHAQQSSAAGALVEKYTNAVDAILLRFCKAAGLDPRGDEAREKFPTMLHAIEAQFGDLTDKAADEIARIAAENVVLYATGEKARPCISLYDSGEGQLAKDFPETFCSLIHGNATGSYKGAIPFVQGRFNMGGTGVLPFCSLKRKLQLIVSRVPSDLRAGRDDHEWAFTLMCFFPGRQDPSWKYLVGPDGKILTAGTAPLGLVPVVRSPKVREVLAPHERKVSSGTLIKMFDFQAPRSNVCGELYRQLMPVLLQPPLPLRIYECRPSYAANIMANTVWDSMAKWRRDGILENGFEDGAGITITLSTGEQVPAEVRVFKTTKTTKTGKTSDVDALTGVRALVNGQSHAKRGEEFFKTKLVDKEHIAGSLLVTLDCTGLGQDSRNAVFMSNREMFREDDPLVKELLDKLKKQLRDHDELIALNARRYEEKVKNAVSDDDGLRALEDLLSTDPSLANLFGSFIPGRVSARQAPNGGGDKGPEKETKPYEGLDFPTYFKRADGSSAVSIEVPQGDRASVSFQTDVKNNYFTRRRPPRGKIFFAGDMNPQPSYRLFNGRLTFSCASDKSAEVGTRSSIVATIRDRQTAKPFLLTINATIVPPRPPPEPRDPKEKRDPKTQNQPSRPDVKEAALGADQPPVSIERNPQTHGLVICINTDSPLREAARTMRPPEEQQAVDFVYKYGLALATMGLLDYERTTDAWKENDAECRKRLAEQMSGLARVIVPLCLALPKNLPKQ